MNLFPEVPVIPDCTDLLNVSFIKLKYKTAAKIADEIVREARQWQSQHPNMDVMEIITPEWRDYVRYNL